MKAMLSRIRRRIGRNRRRAQYNVSGGLSRINAALAAKLDYFGRYFALVLPYMLVFLFSTSLPPLLVYGYRYVTHTPSFAAKRIEVDGNDRLTLAQVLETAKVDSAPNVIGLDLAEIEQRLLSHPWISSATIERELPDRLMISIVEYEPVAIIALGARYLVDRKGDIFRRIGASEVFDLPTITGMVREDLDREAPKERRKLAQKLIRGSLSLLESWTRNDPLNVLPISEVHPDPLFGFSVTLRGGAEPTAGAVIHLGHGDVASKLGKLAVVLADAQRQSKEIAEVRLDNERDPGRVAVRFRGVDQSANAELGAEPTQINNSNVNKVGSRKAGQRRERL